jgi:hypothetical protein
LGFRDFGGAFEPGCERANIESPAVPPPWRSWATLLRASYQTQKLIPTSTRTTITPIRTASKPESPPLLLVEATVVVLAVVLVLCELAFDSALPRLKLDVAGEGTVDALAAVVVFATVATVDVAEPAADATGAARPAVAPKARQEIVRTSANGRRMSTRAS